MKMGRSGKKVVSGTVPEGVPEKYLQIGPELQSESESESESGLESEPEPEPEPELGDGPASQKLPKNNPDSRPEEDSGGKTNSQTKGDLENKSESESEQEQESQWMPGSRRLDSGEQDSENPVDPGSSWLAKKGIRKESISDPNAMGKKYQAQVADQQ